MKKENNPKYFFLNPKLIKE